MRLGPSRLTSTAPSSGESKATVAAEWMTMSQVASAARPASSRPRPSAAHVAGDDRDPAVDHGVELGAAQLLAQAVEGVVAEDLPLARWATAERLPGRISSTSSQSGTERSRRSTRAVPRKPVPPVMAMRLPARASGIIRRVYHLVDGEVDIGRGQRRRVGRPHAPGAGPPTASSTPPSAPSAPGATERTSLDDLAAELGVRKQTILYWYPSKDALLDAVIDRTRRRGHRAAGAALATAGQGFARVEAMVRAMFRLAARHPSCSGSCAR